MSNRNVHVWKSVTAEGAKREVRAEKFGGKWRIQAKVKGDERWTYYDVPEMDDLLELHDILFRKYQRKRLAHSDVLDVEKMIRDRGGKIAPVEEEVEEMDEGDS